MIVLRFTGGLGNQMFQYALYRYLKRKYPRETVKADISWYSWNKAHQGFELNRLFKRADNPAFELDEAKVGEIFRVSGKLPQKNELIRYFNRIVRLLGERSFEEKHIFEDGHEHSHEELRRRIDNIPPGKDAYITGYFLDEVYYRNDLEELRNCFTFDIVNLSQENREILERIDECESVSIHVRRGDYLSKTYSDTFKILSEDYYRKAVDHIKERITVPRFFIFSDDKEFALSAFNYLENKEVVTGNSGENSYLDMFLMSRCRYNITANSTFSEWAGLLNSFEKAIIIYPREYLSDKDSEIKTIEGWVRL